MRFLRRLILIAALAAGAAYVKQLLEEQQDEGLPTPAPGSDSVPSASSSASGSTENGSQGNGAGEAGEATKAELYEQAQRLGIEGRSKMSKAELERAVRAAS